MTSTKISASKITHYTVCGICILRHIERKSWFGLCIDKRFQLISILSRVTVFLSIFLFSLVISIPITLGHLWLYLLVQRDSIWLNVRDSFVKEEHFGGIFYLQLCMFRLGNHFHELFIAPLFSVFIVFWFVVLLYVVVCMLCWTLCCTKSS